MRRLTKTALSMSALVAIALVIGAAISASLMNPYTDIRANFRVQKSIVVNGEVYNRTYLLLIDIGDLYQGECRYENIEITNRASVNLTVNISCEKVALVYNSGYEKNKDPENASIDWGISVKLAPEHAVTVPAKSRLNITLEIAIAPDATPANEDDDRYDHYVAEILVRPVAA